MFGALLCRLFHWLTHERRIRYVDHREVIECQCGRERRRT